MENTRDFATKYSILLTSKRIDRRPDSFDRDWARTARHWQCTITAFGREMGLFFSQGAAHVRPPEVAEVLDCLASDATGLTSGDDESDFADWCSELGLDPDSRKAYRMWEAGKAQTESLRALLGDKFDELLECERL